MISGRIVPLWVIAASLLALAFVAYSPYLSVGFAGDDFIFLSMLEGAAPYDPVMGLWYGELGSYPAFSSLWWMERGVQGAFLRPLPSWTLTLLYELFGRNAVPYHVLMVFLHGLVAFSAFLVLRRISGRGSVSMLAATLFLICEDHGMTVAWIATITDLMCVLFLNLALLCHIGWRQEGTRWRFMLSLALSLAAIASKETAVVYPAIIICYELLFVDAIAAAPGGVSFSERIGLFARRWWAWAIPSAIFILYMVFYRGLVPPMRNLMYQDPLGDPLGYLSTMFMNLPVMFSGLLTQFLPSIVTFVPGTFPYVALGGAILTVVLLWALYRHRGERALWFSLAVFVLGLLPGLATDPGERLLYLPSAFGMFLVAWLIVQLGPLRRKFVPDALPGVRVLGTLSGLYLTVVAAVVPLVLLFLFPSMWISGLQLPERTVLQSMPVIEGSNCEHVVYLNTNSSFNSFYLKDIYRYHCGDQIDVHLLSSFNGRVWAKLEPPRTLVLKTEDVGWLSNMFARVVRVTPKISPGDIRDNGLFTATVSETTPDKTDALEVRFDFYIPVEDRSISLICYDGRQYRRWVPSEDWELLNPTLDEYGF